MTNDDEESLSSKRNRLVEKTGTRKGIHFTLVTVSGYVCISHSEIIHSGVTLDDLFSE